MNETTKTKSKRLSYPMIFFISSIAILVVTLFMAFVKIPPQFGNSMMQFYAKSVMAPAAAGGIIVANGIHEFQGTQINAIDFSTYIAAFLYMFLIFVIGPVLIVLTRIRLKKIKSEGKTPTLWFRIGYVFCFIWMLIVPVQFIATVYGSYPVGKRIKEDNAVAMYRDDVIAEISAIGNAAHIYYVLPISNGGGGKTFLKSKKTLTLNDLGFKEQTSLGRFILYQQKSDTVLYLHFIGNKKGTLTSGDNNPDITHVVEYETVIYPNSHRMNALN